MSRRSVHTNAHGINPTSGCAPLGFRPPAPLEDLQVQLAELKVRRPAHADIPALTQWVNERDRLESWIQILTSSNGQWQSVPVSPGTPPQPAPKEAEAMPFPKKYNSDEERRAAIRESSRRAYAKKHPVAARKAARPEADQAQRPAPAAVSCGLVTPDRISTLRQSIWTLMADLERMPKEARAALEFELGLLDAAAHTAYGLATGRLQVA